MSDADGQIIRLLTEMRDAQRDEQAYRRLALEESLALARRGVRTQRLALLILGLIIAGGAVVLAAGLLAGR